MTDSLRPAAVPAPFPTRRATTVVSALVLVLGLAEALCGAWVCSLAAGDTSEDPFVAVVYLVAAVVGVPGLVATVLAGAGWRLADRRAGLLLAGLAAAVAALPVLLYLFFATGAR